MASISGPGCTVFFGAPQAHEDDPERALRAAFTCNGAVGNSGRRVIPTFRQTVGKTGRRVPFGPCRGRNRGCGSRASWGRGPNGLRAVGAVVGAAAALQSAARPGTVLVGAATRPLPRRYLSGARARM